MFNILCISICDRTCEKGPYLSYVINNNFVYQTVTFPTPHFYTVQAGSYGG